MDYYVYYYPGAEPDLAIVESDSKEDAIRRFRAFFRQVSAENVVKIDCHREGYVDGIMILSEY